MNKNNQFGAFEFSIVKTEGALSVRIGWGWFACFTLIVLTAIGP